jgi:hypothetical protein
MSILCFENDIENIVFIISYRGNCISMHLDLWLSRYRNVLFYFPLKKRNVLFESLSKREGEINVSNHSSLKYIEGM